MARLAVLGLLLLQTILFAVAPAPLLMLAGHEHVVIGVVTPEQWRKHQEAHILAAQVREAHATHRADAAPSAHIISTGDVHSSLSILQGRAAFTVPDCPVICFLIRWSEPVTRAAPATFSPPLDVPHQPPRGVTS
jgi:hypothetical protein